MPVRILTAALATSAVALVISSAAAAAASPSLSTNRGCYVVGQRVSVTGNGFAADRKFDVTIDGVDFGTSTTDSNGAFSTSLRPGGLGAGIAQEVDHLAASDGTTTARTTFTVTRSQPGARFLATSGNPRTLKSQFQVWSFSFSGRRLPVYLHYVSGSGRARKTVSLGHTGGQCGYLLTGRRRVFPFTPSVGTWTLQVDTHKAYARHPAGPVSRIGVQIG